MIGTIGRTFLVLGEQWLLISIAERARQPSLINRWHALVVQCASSTSIFLCLRYNPRTMYSMNDQSSATFFWKLSEPLEV